ncbi:MAG TPA: RNA polymerase sigma factor [Terriglobales bacterium]|nr:RNA polymerase sigma factor [Terriglobales bacterium]
MASQALVERASSANLSDEEVVERVLGGDGALFEILMRRYNQRLYRVARSILRDDAESEDVMQDTYVRAYQHLRQFAGRAKFATWLTRIAVHEALARVQRRSRFQDLHPVAAPEGDGMELIKSKDRDPEQQAGNAELRLLLEEAVAGLAEGYRSVFMLREVEQMSTQETAEVLELTEATVKVRLHRAHALLRRALYERTGATATHAFAFEAPRCDRVVSTVFSRLAELPSGSPVRI